MLHFNGNKSKTKQSCTTCEENSTAEEKKEQQKKDCTSFYATMNFCNFQCFYGLPRSLLLDILEYIKLLLYCSIKIDSFSSRFYYATATVFSVHSFIYFNHSSLTTQCSHWNYRGEQLYFLPLWMCETYDYGIWMWCVLHTYIAT